MKKRILSPAAIRHGSGQVRNMLSDRPAMGRYVKQNDVIWKWAARKFSGEDLSDTIDWNHDHPRAGFQAENFYPLNKNRGFIRVNHAQEQLWIWAIEAFYQITKAPVLESLYQLAFAGHFDKKDWILKCAEVDYQILKKINIFYRRTWLPWCKQKKIKTEPSLWGPFIYLSPSFKEWIQRYDDTDGYPWNYWGYTFDHYVLPARKETIPTSGFRLKNLFRKRPLPTKDIHYGEKQLRQMLRDRPDMNKHITKNDPLWEWATKQFAGEYLSAPIEWDGAPPASGAGLEYTLPFEGQRGSIRINDASEYLWALAIFELNNIAMAKAAEHVYQKAFRGELRKEEFILGLARTEYTAIRNTQKFYKTIWRPWCKKKGLFSSNKEYWNIWSINSSRNFTDWINQFTDQDQYPFNCYGYDYDKYVRPHILKTRA